MDAFDVLQLVILIEGAVALAAVTVALVAVLIEMCR